jgi:hypothetical protein
MWSKKSNTLINDIKRTILMKKIMLNFMIDNYSKYDKLFRYCHMSIAALTPTIATINKLASTNEEQSNTVTLILSSLVAAMIKIKDYLKFDKIKDVAKQQTIKYEQLYQRIEREMLKSIDKRQTEDDFIYWINREFNNIEISDPDLSQSLKQKYIKFCKDNHIPFDNDIDSLQILIHNKDVKLEQIKSNEIKVLDNCNTEDITVIEHNIVQNDSFVNIDEMNTRARTLSDENDKKEYKQKIQELDINKDLNWALERLNTITDA